MKKKTRGRNGVAKSVRTPRYKMRVVNDKREKQISKLAKQLLKLLEEE